MKHKSENTAVLLARVLDQFAYEIDVNYEQEDIANVLPVDDSTFTAFCSAVQELRSRGVPVSNRVLHVERRIEAAMKEGA